MATLEGIRKKIESAEDLQSVVKTMKGLAAANIWQYERAVEALADYSRTVEMGLQIVLRNRAVEIGKPKNGSNWRLGAVVFGSDQGMVGRFNEQLVTYTFDTINKFQVKRENRSILAVGLRVTARLEAAHQPIEESFLMPGSITGITPKVQEIILRLEAWRSEQQLDQILLFHNQPLSGSTYRPRIVQLLPLDLAWLQQLKQQPWPTQMLPAFTMPWERLFSALIREYFFVSLYRAFAESLASENASRLASMQAAEKNIEERLADLEARFHQQRQQVITAELLDIVAGAEALADDKN